MAPHDRRHHGWVAQLVEQWTENPRVAGSIPAPATPLEIRKVQQILTKRVAGAAAETSSRRTSTRAFSKSRSGRQFY